MTTICCNIVAVRILFLLGEGGVARDWGGVLKPLQMNAKTRSAEVFFSLGSSENILTPGVDSQFYGPVFVFLRICLSIFFSLVEVVADGI